MSAFFGYRMQYRIRYRIYDWQEPENKTYDIVYFPDVVYDIVCFIYDIVHLTCNIVYKIVYDVVYTIGKNQQIETYDIVNFIQCRIRYRMFNIRYRVRYRIFSDIVYDIVYLNIRYLYFQMSYTISYV